MKWYQEYNSVDEKAPSVKLAFSVKDMDTNIWKCSQLASYMQNDNLGLSALKKKPSHNTIYTVDFDFSLSAFTPFWKKKEEE